MSILTFYKSSSLKRGLLFGVFRGILEKGIADCEKK